MNELMQLMVNDQVYKMLISFKRFHDLHEIDVYESKKKQQFSIIDPSDQIFMCMYARKHFFKQKSI